SVCAAPARGRGGPAEGAGPVRRLLGLSPWLGAYGAAGREVKAATATAWPRSRGWGDAVEDLHAGGVGRNGRRPQRRRKPPHARIKLTRGGCLQSSESQSQEAAAYTE